MSETEFHTGKATRICNYASDFQSKIAIAVIHYGLIIPLEDDPRWEIDFKRENLYVDGFAYFDGDLWKVEDTKHEEHIIKATKVGRDTFEYILHYYNGGAGFKEVLEEAVKKAEGK